MVETGKLTWEIQEFVCRVQFMDGKFQLWNIPIAFPLPTRFMYGDNRKVCVTKRAVKFA